MLGHGEPEVNSQSVVLEQCSLLTCCEEFLHVRDNPFEDFYFCWFGFNFSAMLVNVKLLSYPNKIYFVLSALKRRFLVSICVLRIH